MTLQLRTSDDAKRLFSALSELSPKEPPADLSLYDIDERALMAGAMVPMLDEASAKALALSVLVAMATAWVAIRAYERSDSMTWALAWGAFGFLTPLPAVAVSYYLDVN